jgi:NADH:ubiquinone oxidoreductase subunit 6 (subunit J)
LIRILFVIIASLGILMALGSVLARNLVHAALYLIGFFFLVACVFILLEAEFLAAMQVLVYIGAVAIILMFGIMLTRNIQGDETTGGHWLRKAPAAIIGLGLFLALVTGIWLESGPIAAEGRSKIRQGWSQISERPDMPPAAIQNMGMAVGVEMMTRFVVPFEIAGLLLTAALVGAIALAAADEPEHDPRHGPRVARAGDRMGDGNGLAGTGTSHHDALTPASPTR